jgi:hypothetical protein
MPPDAHTNKQGDVNDTKELGGGRELQEVVQRRGDRHLGQARGEVAVVLGLKNKDDCTAVNHRDVAAHGKAAQFRYARGNLKTQQEPCYSSRLDKALERVRAGETSHVQPVDRENDRLRQRGLLLPGTRHPSTPDALPGELYHRVEHKGVNLVV